MTAKWVGDALGKDGIYSVWIAMRKYPWLPPVDYRDTGETAAQVMTSTERLVVIEDGSTLRELGKCPGHGLVDVPDDKYLDDLVKKHNFHGFPVVHNRELVGYATRDKLMLALESLLDQEPIPPLTRRCTFSSRRFRSNGGFENLSEVIEEAVLQLRKELPQELVVNMFQKLVCINLSS